jgi:MEMO1 family protein
LRESQRPIREPAVAGTFYPEDPGELTRAVDRLLEHCNGKLEPDRELRALISPHAGYSYSGVVAAEAYACLKGRGYSTVVLIGPDHYIGFEGVAVYPGGAFRTPLGDVAVDEELAALFLEAGAGVQPAPEAHRREHALEVQLPFLQRILPNARIVPVLMGFRSRTNVEIMANVLSRALDNPRVVLVASTDLSHYHPRDVAHRLDSRVTDLVRAFAPTSLWEELRAGNVEACGGDPLVAVMLGAAIAGAEQSRILRYSDSGESTGDSGSVVGYLSAALFKGMPATAVAFSASAAKSLPEVEELVGTGTGTGTGTGSGSSGEIGFASFTPAEIDVLLHLAIESARTGMHDPLPVLELRHLTPRLRAPGRAFVTLRRGRELRGCVGYIETNHALWETVARAARAAAHEDRRFAEVRPEEVPELIVEVSVLTPPVSLAGPGDIRIGQDGVIVTQGSRRGLLLPQAALEYGWDGETLLAHACRKAGLAEDAWKKGARLERFQARIFEAAPGHMTLNGES